MESEKEKERFSNDSARNSVGRLPALLVTVVLLGTRKAPRRRIQLQAADNSAERMAKLGTPIVRLASTRIGIHERAGKSEQQRADTACCC